MNIDASHPVRVDATDDTPIQLLNRGDSVYYGYDSAVSAQNKAGQLTAGDSITLTVPVWVRSASSSHLDVSYPAISLDADVATDISAGDAATLAAAATYTDAKPSVTIFANASHTFALGNEGNTVIECTRGTAQTLTIATNANVAFDVGSEILVQRCGAGSVTFAAAGGVTLQSANGLSAISAQYGTALLRQRSLDTWVLEVS